jgi:hypothetical protein
MLRLIFVLALWGCAGIILIGPAIAVLAVVLSLVVTLFGVLAPFVVLGLFFWVPYRLLFARKRSWRQEHEAMAPARDLPTAPWCARGLSEAASWPGRLRSRMMVLGGIVLEIMCGAMIGGGLGWALASSLTRHETVLYVLLGCLTGAGLGLLVGLTNHMSALRDRTSTS